MAEVRGRLTLKDFTTKHTECTLTTVFYGKDTDTDLTDSIASRMNTGIAELLKTAQTPPTGHAQLVASTSTPTSSDFVKSKILTRRRVVVGLNNSTVFFFLRFLSEPRYFVSFKLE